MQKSESRSFARPSKSRPESGASAKATSVGAGAKHWPSEILSMVVFAVSIFALLSLMTFNPGDPSLFSNAKGIPLNLCGRVGAWIAALFLHTFGLAGFLLPAALFFFSATIYKREGVLRLLGTLAGMTVAVMAFAVFLTLQWKFWPYAGALLLTGGAVGTMWAEVLVRDLNPVGSSIVSLLVFALALALSTPLSVARMGATVLSFVGRWGWRLARVVGGYCVYMLGLVAMRAAQALSDGSQRLVESMIEQARAARDRAERRREERAHEREEEKAQRALLAQAEAEARAEAMPKPAAFDGADALAEEIAAANDLASAQQMELKKNQGENALDAPGAEFTPPFSKDPIDISKFKKIDISPLAPQFKSAPDSGSGARKSKAGTRKGQWQLPKIDFLKQVPKIETAVDKERLYANSQILKQKFADFGIDGEVVAARPGPVITLYEFKPGPGVKVSRIAALADDLSMALSAQSVRILAPLPGKAVVGIEIPNEVRETVLMREFLQHTDFFGDRHMIPVAMGKDISGAVYLSDLMKMPHLLCAGQTGSGKSVFMNGLICSLLYRFTPDDLRMILVDPKFIEFRAYQEIPHLLLPVVDDPKKASTALKWGVREMERRYRILAKLGVRNLDSYNQKVDEMGSEVVHDLLFSEDNVEITKEMSGSDWIDAFEADDSGNPRVGKLPYIVIIIDELADLMMVAKKEVEVSIARLSQKARAAGIHLVIATQRPSTDVVTGLIKANLPSRASFQLASYVDSKTILDRSGAERLLGRGDMLFIPPGTSNVLRLHGAYLDDGEIEKVTSFLRSQGKPAYRDEIVLAEDDENSEGFGDEEDQNDPLFGDAIDLAKRSGTVSASYLQRHLKIGYNRAARMVETMEERGIVGPADGARPREVLLR